MVCGDHRFEKPGYLATRGLLQLQGVKRELARWDQSASTVFRFVYLAAWYRIRLYIDPRSINMQGMDRSR